MRLVIRLRSEWLVFPRSPQTLGKFFLPAEGRRLLRYDGGGFLQPGNAQADGARADRPRSRTRQKFPSFHDPSAQLQNGRLPMADRIPLTMCFLKKACPTYPEPSVHAAESCPSAVTQERPPS